MADLYETLKKITYDNLPQFVEDINRNFAMIQNSPLYKGLPGDEGNPGNPGLRGDRGSRFFFVDVNAFNEQFKGEIVNGSVITLDWLNSKLQNFEEKNKLLKALGTDTLVDTDIIVLTNSIMLQYILLEDILKDTGIAFNEQSNLVSSIETKIEQYVKYYVDNHPSILAIQNIFEHYITYAKNYTSTNNTYITNAQTKSSVYMPYFAGITDTQGVRLENHKYFGFADKEFPESNNGTIVFGSMKRYARLMLQTVSTTQKDTYTSDYAPGENNIPSAIFLQDTDNACLMFGRKMASNLRRFGMIYKDKDDNLIIKSDMGNLDTDFSSIILNKNFLKYAKEVWFNDNLNLDKDFLHVGNTNNKFYRTAEYIWNAASYGPTSLQEGTQEQLNVAAEKRRKIMEVGYWLKGDENPGADAEYRNLNEHIILPWFTKNVLVTDDKGEILKTYFVEVADIKVSDTAISNENLDDFVWKGTTPSDHAILTSNYLEAVIRKINAVQQYTKANYWRKDQYAATVGKGADIPSLYLSQDLMVNNIAKFGPNEEPDKQYFIPSIADKTLTLGSNEAGAKSILRTTTVQLSKYNNLTDLVLTMDVSGNILKTYFREKTSLTNKTIASITASKEFDSTTKYLTSNYYQWLIERVNESNNNLRDNYWRKEEYFPTNAALIPSLWLKEDLKCRYITATGIKTTQDSTTLDSKTISIGTNTTGSRTTVNTKELLVNYLNANHFVTTNASKILSTTYVKETVALPSTSGLEQVTLPTITNPETHILTSEYLVWLNTRINNVVGGDDSGLLGLYWKKSEYKGFIIPDLELSGILNVRGNIKIGPDDNPFIVTTLSNKTIEIGQSGTETNTTINSDVVCLKDTDFQTKVLVTDDKGNIRKDITMCTDTSATESADNNVPTNTDDSGNAADAGSKKTKDWKKIITGQQMAWLHTFMNNVKKRFLNTFNRKETIDEMYKHFPVGGIIMWTYASSQAAGIAGKIPAGWAVCDGSKLPNSNVGIPDLTNLFVRGVSNISEANGIAGADNYKLTTDNLPKVTLYPEINNTDTNGQHSHSYVTKAQSTFYGGYKYLSSVANPNLQGLSTDKIGVMIGKYGENVGQSEGDKSSDNKFWKADNTAFTPLSYLLGMIYVDESESSSNQRGKHTHSIKSLSFGQTTPTVVDTVPRYYKVLYIMKFDTRIAGGTDYNDKYTLVP